MDESVAGDAVIDQGVGLQHSILDWDGMSPPENLGFPVINRLIPIIHR